MDKKAEAQAWANDSSPVEEEIEALLLQKHLFPKVPEQNREKIIHILSQNHIISNSYLYDKILKCKALLPLAAQANKQRNQTPSNS